MEERPEFKVFDLMGMTTVIADPKDMGEVQKIMLKERGLLLAMTGNVGKVGEMGKVRMTFLPKEAFKGNQGVL